MEQPVRVEEELDRIEELPLDERAGELEQLEQRLRTDLEDDDRQG